MFVTYTIRNFYNFYLGKIGRKIAVTWRRYNSLQIRFISIPIYSEEFDLYPLFRLNLYLFDSFFVTYFYHNLIFTMLLSPGRGLSSEQSFLRVLSSVFFSKFRKSKGLTD
jgi:hypothetical protein